jgi:hypothetical protein
MLRTWSNTTARPHLLQQADTVLAVVEVSDPLAGDRVGESRVGRDLARVAGVGLVAGDDLERGCTVLTAGTVLAHLGPARVLDESGGC